MEEHFRKSLGEDYSKVFKESEKKKPRKCTNWCIRVKEAVPFAHLFLISLVYKFVASLIINGTDWPRFTQISTFQK